MQTAFRHRVKRRVTSLGGDHKTVPSAVTAQPLPQDLLADVFSVRQPAAVAVGRIEKITAAACIRVKNIPCLFLTQRSSKLRRSEADGRHGQTIPMQLFFLHRYCSSLFRILSKHCSAFRFSTLSIPAVERKRQSSFQKTEAPRPPLRGGNHRDASLRRTHSRAPGELNPSQTRRRRTAIYSRRGSSSVKRPVCVPAGVTVIFQVSMISASSLTFSGKENVRRLGRRKP